jgi:hypothetical protein
MIEDITRELQSRYDCKLVRLTGGYTNITFLLEGTSPLLVAKVTRLMSDTENNFSVLDWEWAEWGNALNDVAWICWFTKLHYSEIANILNRTFMEEYISYNPISIAPDQLKTCSVYKVWNVLHRVRHAKREVKTEWLRRLEWTLNIDFSDVVR